MKFEAVYTQFFNSDEASREFLWEIFYTMTGNSLKLSEYVVAFIDILGAKKMMKSDDEGFLNEIYDVYNRTKKAIKDFESLYGSLGDKIFSDNILLAYKVDENLFKSFWRICEFSSALQAEFLKKNIRIRGGISFGSFFIDGLLCWGDALVRAYQLESQVAIYPRIICDYKFYENFSPDEHELHSSLSTDFDGVDYIDYLHRYIDYQDRKELEEFINDVKKELNDCEDDKIRQKLLWHKNYLNSKLAAIKEQQPVRQFR